MLDTPTDRRILVTVTRINASDLGPEAQPLLGVTVDVVALTIREGALSVLLIEREGPPFAGTWALPGAFVTARADGSWETLEELAARVLAEEAGVADLGGHHLEQLATFGTPERDPRMRVISIGYLVFAPNLPEAVAGRAARTADWVAVAPGATGIERRLAFDHAEILAAGLERARAKLEYTTLATAFLPGLFTLSDLQSVYEAVWGTDLDLSNLRRKVLGAAGFVAPTGLAATRGQGERGRPAELYRAGAGAILNPPITRPSTRATSRVVLDARRPRMGSKAPDPDLIVVGAGIAGLTAALTASERGARVQLLVRGPIAEATSSSWFAQGGVAAVQGADDELALHVQDTLAAGRGLCRLSAVETLVREIPDRVAELRSWGVPFDDDLGLEGGHSRRRIAHVAGAETGRAITQVLVDRVLADRRIVIAEGERALAVVPGSHLVTDRRTVAARSVILATGGYAALWSRTSNPVGSIGDGLVIAWRAGARLADLEFVQFHPTVLTDSDLLLSEALRGDGATLIELDGSRFIDELAPRDVVARAVAAHPDARLDLRPVDQQKFVALMDRLTEAGYTPVSSPVPVQPAAHFSVGGIVTDLNGATSVEGLYAAGECANTGLHGANRLASNSLAECLVFGRRAAIAAVAALSRPYPMTPATTGAPSGLPRAPRPDDGPLTEEEREALWRGAGLTRDAAGPDAVALVPGAAHPDGRRERPVARGVAGWSFPVRLPAPRSRPRRRAHHHRWRCRAHPGDVGMTTLAARHGVGGPPDLSRDIRKWLAEDVGAGDRTTDALVPDGATGHADILLREPGIVCGLDLLRQVFLVLDARVAFTAVAGDGDRVTPGVVARLAGPARAILTGERLALNLLGRLSGIATLTRRYVDAVAGTRAVILDTRKTTPGLRVAEKWAVRCGGGANHRMGLHDAVLIKDNHLLFATGLADAVAAARGTGMQVQVECDTTAQVQEAVAARADRILLDNMPLPRLREAVELVGGRIPTEASGGVTLDTVADIARTGVDYISVGALTHAARSLDVSLEVIP